ncbi:hypothetical protein E2C01_025577 [Portunus trituberculatus]|uniref:Uncharacterized protein n=1 Tax=Portunus trituberculatus TaxID=210409 RepID=A0A5B7EFM9_PORTR|nr:hypothetical protein [Portunus trituberculatus]
MDKHLDGNALRDGAFLQERDAPPPRPAPPLNATLPASTKPPIIHDMMTHNLSLYYLRKRRNQQDYSRVWCGP